MGNYKLICSKWKICLLTLWLLRFKWSFEMEKIFFVNFGPVSVTRTNGIHRFFPWKSYHNTFCDSNVQYIIIFSTIALAHIVQVYLQLQTHVINVADYRVSMGLWVGTSTQNKNNIIIKSDIILMNRHYRILSTTAFNAASALWT